MLRDDLIQREAEGRPIHVGVSGKGWMGSGFIAAMAHVPGMKVPIIANDDIDEARQAFLDVGISGDEIIETADIGSAADAIRSGKRVITASIPLLSQLEQVDIVADVTWSPAIGVKTAFTCIQNRKDVVLVNIEADVTVGRRLKQLANDAGVLYTVSSGDEPACLMDLYDFVTSLGHEVIAIGKGKNNPLNCEATPDSVTESAKRSDKDPYQVASYVDGTKTMFEMTCAANATGCMPMQRGMIGPEAKLETVSEIFALEEDGGISRFPGVIDFVQGTSMAGGVFVTIRMEDERIRADLEYLKVGEGKYFTFFRPYHLWFLEAPISIARAHLYRETTLVPLDHPVADVITVAKRDLEIGESLDTFGGFTFFGLIENVEVAKSENALPVGLAPDAQIVKQVRKGEVVTWDHVALDESSLLVKLRRQQDG